MKWFFAHKIIISFTHDNSFIVFDRYLLKLNVKNIEIFKTTKMLTKKKIRQEMKNQNKSTRKSTRSNEHRNKKQFIDDELFKIQNILVLIC